MEIRFYRCETCGQIIAVVKKTGAPVVCCGKPKKEMVPKYKLVHSHTARRTGATLMYLAGIPIYDIMRVTGHKSINTLEKYIRADKLEVAHKLRNSYAYFK